MKIIIAAGMILFISLVSSAKELSQDEQVSISKVKDSLRFHVEQFTVASILSKANLRAHKTLTESGIYTQNNSLREDIKEMSLEYLSSKNCEEIKKYTYEYTGFENTGLGVSNIFTNVMIATNLFSEIDSQEKFVLNGRKAIEALSDVENNCTNLEVASNSMFKALTHLREMSILLSGEFK